jgi:hypothetical protein
VVYTYDFESANDQSAGEKRVISFYLVKYPLENFDFLLDSNWIAIIIDHHTKDVSQLKHKYHFLNEHFENLEQDLLEKVLMVVEF